MRYSDRMVKVASAACLHAALVGRSSPRRATAPTREHPSAAGGSAPRTHISADRSARALAVRFLPPAESAVRKLETWSLLPCASLGQCASHAARARDSRICPSRCLFVSQAVPWSRIAIRWKAPVLRHRIRARATEKERDRHRARSPVHHVLYSQPTAAPATAMTIPWTRYRRWCRICG